MVTRMEFPPPISLEKAYTLSKSVSAIQILPTEDGERTRLGLITCLPRGAEIEIGGPGFSDRTVSVRSVSYTHLDVYKRQDHYRIA